MALHVKHLILEQIWVFLEHIHHLYELVNHFPSYINWLFRIFIAEELIWVDAFALSVSEIGQIVVAWARTWPFLIFLLPFTLPFFTLLGAQGFGITQLPLEFELELLCLLLFITFEWTACQLKSVDFMLISTIQNHFCSFFETIIN